MGYYLDDDGPFCHVCWDIDGKLVREVKEVGVRIPTEA